MSRLRRYIQLGLALVLLAAAGMLVEPLHRKQVEYDLTSEPVKGVSPGVVLATTALGAFRGIIVDVVWIRMENLKNEGKFFEIVQLADLACRLAPRFPKVWDFNAWNMAYNVSVQVPEYPRRWPWVKKGIELLRQEGIPNNTEEPELYFSLAWIFMHKVGDQLDDAHFFYKQELGLKMHEVLGGSGSVETLREFASVPRSRQVLVEQSNVREFYQRLVAAGFDPLARSSEGETARFFVWVRRPEQVPERARELLQAEGYREEREALANFVRARRLRGMNMDPTRMIGLMEKYGPLDWRGPYAHAIYWASEGKRVAESYREQAIVERTKGKGGEEVDWGGDFPQYRYHDINYDRVIYGAMQSLVSRGRLLFDADGNLLPMMGPDYRFTDSMIEEYERIIGKYGREGRYSTGVNAAYENFLKRVTTEYYYMGDVAKSRRYFRKLREEYPKDRYKMSYTSFINGQMKEYVEAVSASQARNLVRALLRQSYFYLGAGIDSRADGLYERARRIAALWNEKRDVADDPRLSQELNFNDARKAVLTDIFAGRAGFPRSVQESLKERLPAALVEQVLPDETETGPKPLDVPEEYRREN